MAGTNPRRAAPARTRRSTRGSSPATGSKGGDARGTGTAARKRRFVDYPRSGFHGLHRWLPSWRFLLGSFLAVAFLGFGAVVAAYATVQVPQADADTQSQTTTVYFADGADGTPGNVMGTFQVQKRQIVDYATLPEYVGRSVAASEDRTFFENKGVDVKGMARAFWHNLRREPGQRAQGGSTLTQQYVERYYVDKTTTDYVGKAKEALLALKVTQQQSKEEILGGYLNTIYWGRDSYGIQAAAQSYFGVDAKDLTISQAAMLAGIIPSPNNWDPAVSPTKAKARWTIVLDSMEELGWVTPAERATLVFPETIDYQRPNSMTGPNGLLLQMVLDELQKPPLNLSRDQVNRRGYQVHTTIREDLQAQAVAAAEGFRAGTLDGQRGTAPFERTKFSISSVDPHTGGIVALYGGTNTEDDQINHATYDKVQGGSTFKPFTLLAALREGVSLDTRFNGSSPQKPAGWDPANPDKTVSNFGTGKGEQFGNIDLVEATAQSVNTVYAQLNLQIGPDKTAKAAADAGITTPVSPVNASNVLGTDDVHPVDMADAYATIANSGVHHAAHIVATVVNHDGSTAFQFDATGNKAFEPDIVADATYAMQQVVQHGSGADWVKPLGRPIAGKTGTTQDNKAAWFVGFTPDLVTAVAMNQSGDNGTQESIKEFGKTRTGSTVYQVTGGTWPAFLWASYMKQAFTLAPYSTVVDFPPRADVGSKPTESPTEAPPTEVPTEAPPTEQAPQEVVVPAGLENKLEADASAPLYDLGLIPAVVSEPSDKVPYGRVIRTDPKAGTVLAPGSTVSLVVSSGPKAPPTKEPKPTPTPTTPPTQEPDDPPVADPAPTKVP